MKARLLRDMACRPCEDFPDGIKLAGAMIDHPRVFRLVQMGVAEPVDEECRLKANRMPEDMAEAAHAYARTAAGIHPEDFVKFDAGEIAGYYPDGSYIPGPAIADNENLELIDEDDDWEEDGA